MPRTKTGEFATFGVTLANGYEWAGEEAQDSGKIVLSLHPECFNYKVSPPIYSVFGDKALLAKPPTVSFHCRERTRMLKRALAEKRPCHVVITPRIVNGAGEHINGCPHAQPGMVLRIVRLDENTGEFEAEVHRAPID